MKFNEGETLYWNSFLGKVLLKKNCWNFWHLPSVSFVHLRKFSEIFHFLYRVIVGAPQADTSSIQPNVRRGGAVYRCDITDDNRCQVVPFDKNGKRFVIL